MASYRLYCMDQNGRIGLAEWIEAKDDAEALLLARSTNPKAQKCEVWAGRRIVGILAQGDFMPTASASIFH
jgi:hypothetical protein